MIAFYVNAARELATYADGGRAPLQQVFRLIRVICKVDTTSFDAGTSSIIIVND